MKNIIRTLVLVLLLPLLSVAQYNPNGGGSGSGASLTLNNLTSPTAVNLNTLTFSGAAGLTAGGTNQNIEMTPSGTGIMQSDAQTMQVGTNTSATSFLNFTGNGTFITNTSGNTNIILQPHGTGVVSIGSNLPATGTLVSGLVSSKTFGTQSNCASAASPAVCTSASAGRFVISASATSVTVNTTAVTVSSEILVTEDQSLGTALSVTCNTGITQPVVTARVAGTSFTVSISAGLATNPVCFSYLLMN